MSDELKKFIANNKTDFDEFPNAGHFDRFRLKIEYGKQLPLFFSRQRYRWINIAAILISFIGIGWVSFNIGKQQTYSTSSPVQASNNEVFAADLAEAEVFFNEQLKQKRNEVLIYASLDDKATGHIMLELKKLETQYLGLKEELSINAENERIINAMIENYRIRIFLLERLLKQLKKSNKIKQQHHENIQA